MPIDNPVERHRLYGETIGPIEPRFVHVEPIRERSGSFHWRIRAHAHDDLHQILLVTQGGGVMQAEQRASPVRPPALSVVPARTVHGFEFLPGTDGWVVSLAPTALPETAHVDPVVAALFDRPSCTTISADAAADLSRVFANLARELTWPAPAGALAIESELSRLLVVSVRQVLGPVPEADLSQAEMRLTDRFKTLVEEHFRSSLPVSGYARFLGVSKDRLQAACRRRFGEPPTAILHRRILVEAQRWLIYTDRSVSEIGAALGFADPAYFSRFFKRCSGVAPRAFRATSPGPRRTA